MKRWLSLGVLGGCLVGLLGCGGGSGGGAKGATSSSKPASYQVSTSVGVGGSVTPTQLNVNGGASGVFVIYPDSGYEVAEVSGCAGELLNSSYTVKNVQAPCVVSIVFRLTPIVNTAAINVYFNDAGIHSGEFSISIDEKVSKAEITNAEQIVESSTADNQIAAVLDEFGEPFLMGFVSQKKGDIDLASTAQMMVLSNKRYLGLTYLDIDGVRSRVAASPLFDDLQSSIKRKIVDGSPCPLDPACNAGAFQLADQIATDIELSDLTAPSTQTVAPKINRGISLAKSNDISSIALNDRLSLSHSDSTLSVNTNYLTYMLLRSVDRDTKTYAGWQLISPSKKAIQGPEVDLENGSWDSWYPEYFTWPKLNEEKTDINLNGFGFVGNDNKSNASLEIQGASIVNLIQQINSKEVNWSADGVAVSGLMGMNSLRLIEIGAEGISSRPNTFNLGESTYKRLLPYAEGFAHIKDSLEYCGDYIELISAFADFYEEVVASLGINEEDAPIPFAIVGALKNSLSTADIVIKQVSGASSGIASIKNKNTENQIKLQLHQALSRKYKLTTSAYDESLSEVKKIIKEKYSSGDKSVWLELSDSLGEVFSAYTAVLKVQLKESERKYSQSGSQADKENVDRLVKRIFYIRTGDAVFTFSRLLFDKALYASISENPKIVTQMVFDIGSAFVGELFPDGAYKAYGLLSKNGLYDKALNIKDSVSNSGYFKALQLGKTVGNTLIPFIWDASIVRNRYEFSIVDGELSLTGNAESKVTVVVNGKESYVSSNQDVSQNRPVPVKVGDKIRVSVVLKQSGLFDENRAPWETQKMLPPQPVWLGAIVMPGKKFVERSLCVRRHLLAPDFSIQIRHGNQSPSPVASWCGSGSNFGAGWFEDLTTLERNSTLFSLDDLPLVNRLESNDELFSMNYVVESNDKTLLVQLSPYNMQPYSHTITLDVDTTIDSDGDGISDSEDLWPNNPAYAFDKDRDGMPDEWETLYGLVVGQNDGSLDLDGDGVSNLDEFKNGTDPTKNDITSTANLTGVWMTQGAANGMRKTIILDITDNNGNISGTFKDVINSDWCGPLNSSGLVTGQASAGVLKIELKYNSEYASCQGSGSYSSYWLATPEKSTLQSIDLVHTNATLVATSESCLIFESGNCVSYIDKFAKQAISAFEPEMVQIPGTTYSMSKYETTFDQYDVYVEETGADKPSDEGWGRGNRPVINVSWGDAVAYAMWLSQKTGKSYRLPTEEEWAYSARAGVTTKYFWGDEVGVDNANCVNCGSQWDAVSTAPVGSFTANAFGLFDIHGNAYEWTSSCFEAACGSRRILGGSWGDISVEMSFSSEWSSYLESFRRNASTGFRVVQDLNHGVGEGELDCSDTSIPKDSEAGGREKSGPEITHDPQSNAACDNQF